LSGQEMAAQWAKKLRLVDITKAGTDLD